ncbi:MAG: class I SAM-dependent methyltransferase [Oleiphilaceae bacterium]|nr:class I SAM-dependent methyltransferase [Oleiphilaceae bacterium]
MDLGKNHSNSSHCCLLCGASEIYNFYFDQRLTREFYQCQACELVFVPSEFHLCPKEEKEIYDHHDNNPNDPNYRSFLNKLGSVMIENLPTASQGLDFGSGPGPTLSLIFEEAGHECEIYDKFYADDKEKLNTEYDFISSTEVVEHLDAPSQTFELLFSLLRANGILGLMTKLHTQNIDFGGWHYKNDPTHICFYNPATMQYLANRFNKQLTIIGSDVILFT